MALAVRVLWDNEGGSELSKSKVLTQTIYRCSDCNYRSFLAVEGRGFCRHPKVGEMLIRVEDIGLWKPFPKWCPLPDEEVQE